MPDSSPFELGLIVAVSAATVVAITAAIIAVVRSRSKRPNDQ